MSNAGDTLFIMRTDSNEIICAVYLVIRTDRSKTIPYPAVHPPSSRVEIRTDFYSEELKREQLKEADN